MPKAIGSRNRTLLTNVSGFVWIRTASFLEGCEGTALLSPMTHPFGATKTDLEKAFRLKAASKSKTNKQKLESLEFTESELATILFEHPILGSLADYPNGRLLG